MRLIAICFRAMLASSCFKFKCWIDTAWKDRACACVRSTVHSFSVSLSLFPLSAFLFVWVFTIVEYVLLKRRLNFAFSSFSFLFQSYSSIRTSIYCLSLIWFIDRPQVMHVLRFKTQKHSFFFWFGSIAWTSHKCFYLIQISFN